MTPTDAEIMREADKVGGLFDDLAIGYQFDDIIMFARAVLTKWGTPPAVEPVAYLTRDEEGSPAMLFFDANDASAYCDDGELPEPLYTAARARLGDKP